MGASPELSRNQLARALQPQMADLGEKQLWGNCSPQLSWPAPSEGQHARSASPFPGERAFGISRTPAPQHRRLKVPPGQACPEALGPAPAFSLTNKTQAAGQTASFPPGFGGHTYHLSVSPLTGKLTPTLHPQVRMPTGLSDGNLWVTGKRGPKSPRLTWGGLRTGSAALTRLSSQPWLGLSVGRRLRLGGVHSVGRGGGGVCVLGT